MPWIDSALGTIATVRDPERSLLALGAMPADVSGRDAGRYWRELMGDTDDILTAAQQLAHGNTYTVHSIAEWIARQEAAIASEGRSGAFWRDAGLIRAADFGRIAFVESWSQFRFGAQPLAVGVVESLCPGHWLPAAMEGTFYRSDAGPCVVLGAARRVQFGGFTTKLLYSLPAALKLTNAMAAEQRRVEAEREQRDAAQRMEREEARRLSPSGRIAALEKELAALRAATPAGV